jgi:cAMP-binding proteins - catabolite gene activator and regulatory subunit of cAMP-dependent protein kinases
MLQLSNHFSQRIGIDWDKLKDYYKVIKVTAHKILLSEGEIANKILFVREGALRAWFNKDGKDITFQFFFENQAVASATSFFTGKPSPFSIETLEPSVIYAISKKNFEKLYEENALVKDKMIEILFTRFENYAALFLSYIKNNPRERYLELLENDPQIILRVPQHYIASYLGITSVSLSRIRNSIQRGKNAVLKSGI